MINFVNENVCELITNNRKMVLQNLNGRVFTPFLGKKDESYSLLEKADEDIHASYKKPLSSFGHLNFRESMLTIKDKDGFFSNRFLFQSWNVKKEYPQDDSFPHSRNKKDVLEIIYINELKTIEVRQYFALYDEYDTFVSFLKIKNISKDPIHLVRAMSMQIDFNETGFNIKTFTGKWAHERHISENQVYYGIFKNSSICGASSSFNNPAIIVSKDEEYYLFNLIYSSNHQELVQVDHNDTTRVLIGMNDFALDIELNKNDEFVTPEATLTMGTGINQMKISSNNFIKNYILPEKKEYPIIFNSWEATYFSISKDNWKKLAELASQLGAGIFVFDDGWYSNKRNDETSGVGDWFLNKEKMGTFDEINAYLESKNIHLGLWIEPEMVSQDSDLFRNHPDFALANPKIEPVLARHQLMLDFSRREVVDCVLDTLTKLFNEAHPYYIKWDFNRLVTDVYSLESKGGEFFHKYVTNLYYLMSTLKNRFPDILFEGCASGGARFDLGILYYFPLIWTSDCTDAKERIFIQEGTNLVYPTTCISNHVSASPNHQTNLMSSPEDRINISLFGRYGFEINLLQVNKADLANFKKSVEYYNKHKDLIINGDTYLNINNSEGIKGWTTVNKEKDSAIAFVAAVETKDKRVRFEGLDENFMYKISTRKQENTGDEIFPPLSGKDLATKGVTISQMFFESDRDINELNISTRVVRFKKVN